MKPSSIPVQAGTEGYGRSEGIADLSTFIVSPEARWLIGTTLWLDDGEVLSI
jgi:hypothetical protein